ncbi:hypothetical protein KEM56_002870 [Ascosphaera pollenicola]|nr:hypothetical protein KEM56_002870 [Ascosphaera pollenicola]
MSSSSAPDIHIGRVERFAAQYFQLVDPAALSYPSQSSLNRSNVQQHIYDTMFNESRVSPMPPTWYRFQVLKRLISEIEAALIDPDEDEINDQIVSSWGELLSLPRRDPVELNATRPDYIRYTAPRSLDKHPRPYVITYEKKYMISEAGTTGFRTWEAALHLGTFLSTPAGKALVQGKNVIEIGCGVGFLSMYCLKCLDVQSITACDMEQGLIDNIDHCIEKNRLDPRRITTRLWDWSDSFNVQSKEGQRSTFDVAIGADLIYHPEIVPLLLRAIQTLFKHHGVKQFIISATLRNQATFETFLRGCCMFRHFMHLQSLIGKLG